MIADYDARRDFPPSLRSSFSLSLLIMVGQFVRIPGFKAGGQMNSGTQSSCGVRMGQQL